MIQTILYTKSFLKKKRITQLYTEESIPDIKIENNLDVNIEVSELIAFLQNQINDIQAKSESLLEEIERHRKETVSNVDEIEKFIQKYLNELKKEIRQLKYISQAECDYVDITIFDIRAELENLKTKSKYIIVGNNLMELEC